MAGNHSKIPRGLESSHPLGFIQNTDPGAVGAFKPWWVTDDNDEPTELTDFRFRNHDNTLWISLVSGIIVAAPVVSVFGRTGAVVATEGDYTLDQLFGVTLTSVSAGDFLRYNGTVWVNTTIQSGDLGSGTPDNTRFLRGDRTWAAVSGATLADGDYGDITVSSSGTILTIDNGVVTLVKVQDIAQDRILGRISSGTGVVETLTAAQVRTLLALGALALLNTVGAAQIDADAVTTVKILNANVTGAKIESSVALAGSPTTTSQAAGDDSTKICTTATAHDIADAAVAALIAGASAGFDTLAEIEALITALQAHPVPAPIDTHTGTTYTFNLADANEYHRFTNAAGCSATVPANGSVAYPVGTELHGIGTQGKVTLVADTGVTINTPETLITFKAFSAFTVKKVATNEWDLMGDLELA